MKVLNIGGGGRGGQGSEYYILGARGGGGKFFTGCKLIGAPLSLPPPLNQCQNTFVSPSAFSRRAVVSYWRKYVHEVLVNRLGGLSLPRKSVVRLTDRPDMTLDVYRGRKTTMQQQQQSVPDIYISHIEN